LLPRIAHIRERQLSAREKLGDLIAKRNSLETLLAELNSSQDDIEQSLSRLEVDKDGDKIANRLQSFTEFNKRADSRCEELERSLQSLNGLDNELTAMKARATPLMHPETGIRALLQGLQQGRTSLSENLDALEQDEASPLSDRVQQLSDCKAGLEERVSGVLSQLQKLDSIQNDLTALFAKFNRAQRMARELDPRFRVVSQSG
jgi:chromosome segregation ATPase